MQINLSDRTLHVKEGEVPFQRGRKDYHPIIVSITDELGKRIGLGECAPLAGISCDADAYIRMSDAARLILSLPYEKRRGASFTGEIFGEKFRGSLRESYQSRRRYVGTFSVAWYLLFLCT